MADIKCPKCGGVTTIRTAKDDDKRFCVCVKYPECKGMVPVDGDQGAEPDKGGPLPEFDVVNLEWPEPVSHSGKEPVAKSKPRQEKRGFDAGEQYAVSSDEAPAEEDLSGGWGGESPAPKAAHFKLLQRREQSPRKAKDKAEKMKPRKDKGGVDHGIKEPERKEETPVEEDLSGGWGSESPAPKAAHFKLLQRREPSSLKSQDKTAEIKAKLDKLVVDSRGKDAEKKEQPPVEEDLSGGWGDESPAPKAAHFKLLQRREQSPRKAKDKVAEAKPGREKHVVDSRMKKPERGEEAPVEEDLSGGWGQTVKEKPRRDKHEADSIVKKSERRKAAPVKDVSIGRGAESPAPKVTRDIPQRYRELAPTEVVRSPARKPAQDKRGFDRGVKQAAPGKQIPAEDRGTESVAPEPVPVRRREPSVSGSGDVTPVWKSGKVERKDYGVIIRTGRQGRAIIDKDLGIGEDEKPAPEAAADRAGRRTRPRDFMPPRGAELSGLQRAKAPKNETFAPLYKKLPKTFVVPEQEAPVVPPQRKLVKREAYPEAKTGLDPSGQREAEPKSYGSRYKKRPKAGPVMPREPEKPKPAPYKPQYQKPSKWDKAAANEPYEGQIPRESRTEAYRPQYRRGPKPAPLPQEPEKPQPPPYQPMYQRASRLQMASEGKQLELQGLGEPAPAPYRPQYRRMMKPAYVPPQESGLPPTPYQPQFPRAQKRALYAQKPEAPKPRRRKMK